MAIDGRSERSRRTRARVIEAARQLFAEHGYLETTIEEIADLAGVAVQTVYYAFGNKPALLAGVLDVSIAGDLEPVAILDRPWAEELRAEADPVAAVALLSDQTARVVARAAPIYEVIRRAAADPDVAALLAKNRRLRYEAQRGFVEILDGNGHLRDGLDIDAATDIVYGLMNEEIYGLLVTDRGWEPERLSTWWQDLLVANLVTGVDVPGPVQP